MVQVKLNSSVIESVNGVELEVADRYAEDLKDLGLEPSELMFKDGHFTIIADNGVYVFVEAE